MNQRLPYLQEKTLKLTSSPGVYLMKDKHSEIIYIGKAKNLKNRVTSYFRSNPDHTPKVAKMVENVHDYDFIVTDSEYEALLLECSLIKQHKPKYNILLKDDKGYHYIKISDDVFPRITAEKQQNDKTGTYLGPYMSSFIATQTVKEVNKLFKLPTCKNKFSEKQKKMRPCLNFHINQCIGVCNGNITCEEYRNLIGQAVEYIKNGSESSIKNLRFQMEQAAENLDFERAAQIRDRIRAISKSNETQKILDLNMGDCDIVASVKSPAGSCISVLMYRDSRLYDKTTFFFSINEYEENLMESFVLQYYFNASKCPKSIYFESEFENSDIVNKALNEKYDKHIRFFFPKKGNMLKYVMLSKKNAEEYISIKNNRTGREVEALEELGEILGLKKPPMYIESYDISNYSSSSMVAGMIVFENGRPLKKAYKRFSIKESAMQNDYACMQEVLKRRFNEYFKGEDEGFSKLPDLILLDGGQGHVSAVKNALKEYDLNVPIYGLVKDSKHRTRAISTDGGEIEVSKNKPAFILMTKIQDEVHRFSISYMKSKHTKKSINFELTQVKGIGEKKAQKLMIKYKTVANLKNASVEELAKSAGVGTDIAKELYDFIRNELQ
ncbi:MAG: excinuclease ABC subunit UvrC [Clostridium sp.]|nr:excinuclease ABC subunit UvrC [Clostridium sp.]MCM1546960.1 excinuclease ABC subunit UvrC [Ruminococcus sp.]